MADSAKKVILFYSKLSDKTWPDELRKAFPAFEICTQLSDADADNVVAAIVWNHPPGMLQNLKNLRLIQVLGAGVDHLRTDNRLPRTVPIARLVDPGLTARMTEYVLMHCLALHRQVPMMRQAQHERTWRYIAATPPEQACVGVLGLGVLGSACARALSSLGFRVVGWSRSKKEGIGFPTYAGTDELREFQRHADIIVLLLPLTKDTEDLVDRNFLAGIRKGAALINVGRGRLIVDGDLIDALDAGTLRHAVLDVFRTEPLPSEHPFWGHPKITITPHNSSATNPRTALAQIVENVQRALAGQPPHHLVDVSMGY